MADIGNQIVTPLQDLGNGATPSLNDGTTDATSQINLALANARDFDKLLWFPPGIYRIDGQPAISNWSKVSIAGNGAWLVAHSTRAMDFGPVISFIGCSSEGGGIGIQCLGVDGNFRNRTGSFVSGVAGAGIQLQDCTGLWLDRMKVTRAPSQGIILRSATPGTAVGCQRIAINFPHIWDCAQHGMRIMEARDCQVRGGWIRDISYMAPACGIHILPSAGTGANDRGVSGLLLTGTQYMRCRGGAVKGDASNSAPRAVSLHAFQMRECGGQQTEQSDGVSHSVIEIDGEHWLVQGGQIADALGTVNLQNIVRILSGGGHALADLMLSGNPAVDQIESVSLGSGLKFADLAIHIPGLAAKGLVSSSDVTQAVGVHVNAKGASTDHIIDLTGAESLVDGCVAETDATTPVRNSGTGSVTGSNFTG